VPLKLLGNLLQKLGVDLEILKGGEASECRSWLREISQDFGYNKKYLISNYSIYGK